MNIKAKHTYKIFNEYGEIKDENNKAICPDEILNGEWYIKED